MCVETDEKIRLRRICNFIFPSKENLFFHNKLQKTTNENPRHLQTPPMHSRMNVEIVVKTC